MNGLQNWVFSMLKTHCADQFKAATGYSVDEAQTACRNGDKAALERIREHGMQLHRYHPEACKNAAEWAKTAFPAAGAVGENKNNNPTTIERTQ